MQATAIDRETPSAPRVIPREFGPRSRFEAGILGAGLGMLALTLGIAAVEIYRAERPPTEADLHRLIISTEFDRSPCPDGWASDHARHHDLTEAQIAAWYLSDAMSRTDGEIVRETVAYLDNPQDYRWVDGLALTQTQITLCIAESRRLL
ncbi:hypothetical protein [Jannaschia aquimarina]|uniref:Uncharacterized protein n=1 Tax=Jannaschia aquimarina TaxID=935700 RepID=A0A0D1CQ84_9RHOB|nr:hypothetical protein [Jannaschia aquimarina]KIT16912.1 hypothetical protein jaqu_14110 [Jannaschia aquimarina]SNT11760.1 hypothetical protein SAMN05421775_10637 [Jannaschia aquimarina]